MPYIPGVPDSPSVSLARKLGIGAEGRLALLSAPDDLALEVPPGVEGRAPSRVGG